MQNNEWIIFDNNIFIKKKHLKKIYILYDYRYEKTNKTRFLAC